jgi:5-(carboxyamino)imidazole ribonucleotide mutase
MADASPIVGVVMGSSSDWDVMQHAVAVLREFDVPHEARVVSAHRMPDDLFAYAESAAGRGLRAIVAGAGVHDGFHSPSYHSIQSIVSLLRCARLWLPPRRGG